MLIPPTVTSGDTIRAILKRAGRRAVPIRRSFLQRENRERPSPPLAEMVRRHDSRGLDLYLIVLAQASAGEFDVTHPAAVWARALGIEGENPRIAVSKAMGRLLAYELIKRDRVGRRAHIKLLREDGSGQAYEHPAESRDKYLQLPHGYWEGAWHKELSLAAKAGLLIALSLPPEFFLVIESGPSRFGVSADTLERGLSELQRKGLLSRRSIYKPDPLTDLGYRTEFRYWLREPCRRARPTSELVDEPAGVASDAV